MQKIKTLKVKGFRGIVGNDLPFEGKSIVLFGENGHGKSSFVDALEFLFKGQLEYLEEVKTTSTTRHAPHIKHKKEECLVGAEFDPGNISVNRTFDTEPSIPGSLDDYFRFGKISYYILRRKYLLDFIVAQGAPRYAQLAALMGISEIEKVELTMMRKRDSLDQEISSLDLKLKQLNQKLNEKHQVQVTSGQQLVNLVNKSLAKYQSLTISTIEDIPKLKPKLIGETKGKEATEKALKLRNLIDSAVYLRDNFTFLSKHRELWTALESLHKNIKKLEETAFQQILTYGKNIIIEKELDSCPLCQQPIDRSEILAAIDKRLNDFTETKTLLDRIKELKKVLFSEMSAFSEKLSGFITLIKETGYKGDISYLETFSVNLNNLKNELSKEIQYIKLAAADSYQSAYSSPLSAEKNWFEEEIKKISGSKENEELVNTIDLLTATHDTFKEMKTAETELTDKKKIRGKMNAVYECFLKTNHDEVQRIFTELGSDFCRYYKELHPDDEHHEIKLVVKRRASAEIKSKFFSKQEEDPRGFFSEGHLDSLGLCIFLAFVKRFNVGFPLIILDDVVTSIDSCHRGRIGKLLFKEFTDSQFLITTHDNIWFEELCNAQQALGVGGNFVNLRIIRWNLDNGPVLDKYKPRWDVISEKIKQGDKKGVGNEARSCLEWILFEMCVYLRVDTPTKRNNRYEVQELYTPLKNRIIKLLPAVFEQNKKVFQDLEATKFFGNLSSHYNPDFENISVAELKDFVNAVKALYDFFYCEMCREFIQYHQSANVVKCSKGCKNWNTK